MKQQLLTPILALSLAAQGVASAEPGLGGAGGSLAAPTIPEPPAAGSKPTCRETWSKERPRPQVIERLPTRGTAGHVVNLELTIRHQPGEQVFPGGVTFTAAEVQELKQAQFRLPDSASEVEPEVAREQTGETVETKVRLPVIPLPDEAGRHELELPPLPIAIARASGQVQFLCTEAHRILVEDPLASAAEVEVRPDPPPRPQKEIWTAARDAVLALLIALPIAAALVMAFLWLKKRYQRAPKPPPVIPPWELALDKLERLRRTNLLQEGRHEEYLDEVSDALREYLGERYGFDGLESTTRETMRQLKQRVPGFAHTQIVRAMLQQADLVKFAKSLPEASECEQALEQAIRVVNDTMPAHALAPTEPGESRNNREGRG